MAKRKSKILKTRPDDDGVSKKVAKGKLSPVKAVKGRHSANAVLGKHDSAYHNC